MNFIVTLENSAGERKQLSWNLRNSPLAKKWINLMQSNKVEPPNSRYDWINVGYLPKHLNAIWEEMITIVQKLNRDHSANIDNTLLSAPCQENLNKLHQKFHLLAEGNNNAANEISRLNYLVHIAENCSKNIRLNTDSGYMILKFNIFHTDLLEPEDFNEFNEYDEQVGDLAMGYSTIGKNLFHCYIDNDIAVIEQGLVRPKITLSSEVRITTGTASIKNLQTGSQRRDSYYNWCDTNQIKEKYGYDCRDPKHSGGQFIIGKPSNFDPAELNEWAINNKHVKVAGWQIV